MSNDETGAIREVRRVMLLADLTGYTRAVAQLDALALARMLDGLYRRFEVTIAAHHGRVVKFMGDAVFAVFEADAGPVAVECGQALERDVEAARLCWPAQLGVRIHEAVVAEGRLGGTGQFDVLGAGVNHLFRMGGGGGLRISEPVYRQLPNERRGPWKKEKPPAHYTLTGG